MPTDTGPTITVTSEFMDLPVICIVVSEIQTENKVTWKEMEDPPLTVASEVQLETWTTQEPRDPLL
jgi:hypothetical protein